MGMSLYYTAEREHPLSDDERSAIDGLVGEFGIEDQIEEFVGAPGQIDWASFTWREDADSGAVVKGSVRLPNVTLRAHVTGIEHWGRLLGRIRSEVLSDAVWDVRVEGEPLDWFEVEGRFGTTGFDGVDLDMDYD